MRSIPALGTGNSSPMKPIELSGSTSRDKLSEYLFDCKARIKRNWQAPKWQNTAKIEFLFKINFTGQISEIKLKTSCGSDLEDHRAFNAIKAASPLPPPPLECGQSLNVVFVFEIAIPHKQAEEPLKEKFQHFCPPKKQVFEILTKQ